MNHEERNFIEILRRINDIEKKISISSIESKTKVSSGTTLNQRDHRLLLNINTEEHMHLTGDEYRTVVLGVNEHGALSGLLDNDHPQYIRHGTAGYEWDMLAAEVNSISGQIVFVRKGIDDVRNKISEKLFPQIDSTDAVGIYKSDGETKVLVADTLNSRIGINTAPDTAFHVAGTATITNGNLVFNRQTTPVISSNIGITLSADRAVTLNSPSAGVVLSSGTNMRSETFAEDVHGWSVKNSGDAYFRNVKVNKINARIVSTGIEQYVGGRQTMCKSASPLTANFTIPSPGSTSPLRVEPFADYPLVHVFSDGDTVRLIHVSLYNGEYNTNDCWGTVQFSLVSVPGEQTYTFTRSASPNSGSAKAGDIIQAGELVLNFGVSGDGYIVSTVV